MSLEIRFKQDSNSSPQYLSLQDGESLQVFSGEIFQIQNPQVVAQLVPQANDLQVVCHDGSSYIFKSFLDTLFSQEPVLEIKEGTSITWHDFVQQNDGVDIANLPDDQYSQSLLFAPLHVIAMTSESQKWALTQFPPESDERAKDSGIVSNDPSFVPSATAEESQEDSSANTAAISEKPQPETGIANSTPEDAESSNAESSRTDPDNGSPLHYTTSSSLNGINIDIRDFIPQLHEQNLSDNLTITAKTVGEDPIEIEIDAGAGILRLPDNIFDDDNQKKFIISIKDNGDETGTAITITQTKDGGGEVFHLILSHDRVTENNEGALIGKLDTDDSGQGHTYQYSIVSDDSGVFEIVGNVLKLKDGVSIDYEVQPDRYPLTIASIDENGNRIEQTMSVWPEDVNEAASVSSVGVSSLEDVTVAFNPEDFENSFEDEDSDYLEMIRIDSLPDNGVLLIEGEKVTNGQLIDIDQVEDLEFHPDVNWNGNTEFTWSGFDGQKWSGESSPVNITIDAVNDAPVVNVNVGGETANTETPFEIVLPENAFIDADTGDTLTYSGDFPAWLNIDPTTGTLSGTPSPESVGEHTVTITASDSSGETASQSFQLVIDPANRAPTLTQIEDQTTDEGSLFNLDVSSNFEDLDGDALTFSATLENGDSLPDWLSFNSETGVFNGTPRNDDVGAIEVVVTASDGSETISSTFAIDVENTNDGPVVESSILNATTDEDAAFSLDVSENFSDQDLGDTLTFSATLENGEPLPSWLSIDPESGELTGTPENGDVGTIQISVTASDGGATANNVFSLTVENTNDEPVVTTDIGDQNVLEDSSFLLDASEHFDDADLGDTLSYSATLQNGDPLPDWVSVDSESGHISGKPLNADVGELEITVTASDGENATSQSFALTVENTNDEPTLTANFVDQTVNEDSAFNLDVSANFADEDLGDTLTYSASLESGDPLPGWLSINTETGELSGIPENGDVGNLSITVTASDGEASASDTFSVTVENTNDGPSVSLEIDDQSVDEDSAFSLDVSSNFVDEDLGDSLTFTATLKDGEPLPDWLSIDSDTGIFSGTPENGDVGDIDVVVTASDGESSAESTFSVEVENTNDGPVAKSSIQDSTTSEDAAFNIEIASNFSDEDLGDTLNYSATLENGDPLPDWLSFDTETGDLSGTPRNDDVGDISITVTASDGEAQTSQSFTLSVENISDAPTLTAVIPDSSTLEDSAFSLDVSNHFDDVDLGDALTFTANLEGGGDLPEWLSFDEETGQFSGTPENGDVGDLSISVTASDGEASISDTFTVSVENTNDGPVVTSNIGHQTTNEDSHFSLDVSGNFADEDLGDSLNYSATLENGDPLPEWISFDSETGQISGTPANGDVGELDLIVTASDGEEQTSQSFSLTIENTNDTPILTANIVDENVSEDAIFSLDVSENFSDSDLGDELVFEATLENGDPLPSWLTFDESTGQFSGQPENGDVGDISITVVASDGEEIVSDTFSITVENTNDGPTVSTSIEDQTTDEDSVFSLDVSGNFADQDLGDTLTYSATLENGDPLPDWMAIDENTGELSGTPENGDVGNLSITVAASDGQESASDTFSVTVENTNDGPTVSASIDDQTTDEDAAFSLDVSGNFADQDLGDTLTFSATLENGDPLPDWMSIDPDTGELSGTPENGDVGNLSITVTAYDGQDSASDTFSVTVENTNDGPIVSTAIADQSVDEDSSFSLDITSNFSDEDLGDSLTYSVLLTNESGTQIGDGSLPDWLTFDSNTGQFSGTPENGDVGSFCVQVTASDGESSASDIVAVSVENTNDGPIISSSIQDQSVEEDSLFSLDISGNFSDPDLGDTLSFSATLENGDPLPSWLSIDASTGIVSGTPDSGDIGDISISVTASDGESSVSDIFDLDVNSDFPDPDQNINGGNGSQTIVTGSGDDTIDGGNGADTITSGAGDDVVLGGSGSDNINTGSGDDVIDGGVGSDIIDAGSGDDTIYATEGQDTINAGDGDDTFIIDAGKNFGDLYGGDGEDTIQLDGSDITLDFSKVNNDVTNIERLDIDGTGENNLKLSAEDVLDMTDAENRLFIDGGSDDSVEISADFSSQGTETVDGVDYTHYYDAGTDSHLYINNDISDLNTF